MPDVFAGGAANGNDAIGTKVIALAARYFGPGAGLSGSHINNVRDRIVGHAVPDRSASADLPQSSAPCLGPVGERGLREGFRGSAGNRVEALGALAGFHVI